MLFYSHFFNWILNLNFMSTGFYLSIPYWIKENGDYTYPYMYMQNT